MSDCRNPSASWLRFRFHRRSLTGHFLDLTGQRLRFGFQFCNLGLQALRLLGCDLVEQVGLLGDELVKLELRTFAQLCSDASRTLRISSSRLSLSFRSWAACSSSAKSRFVHPCSPEPGCQQGRTLFCQRFLTGPESGQTVTTDDIPPTENRLEAEQNVEEQGLLPSDHSLPGSIRAPACGVRRPAGQCASLREKHLN
jgi:hypothetical protein